ncbi:MAG: ferrous iron transporter B [Desulfamplus sp.]|nr:ferrous iron transporter B [Desulfamplus sp.]
MEQIGNNSLPYKSSRDELKSNGNSKNPDSSEKRTDYVILGNINSGKSTIFEHLTNVQSHSTNIAGITVDIKSGYIQGLGGTIYDTPGIYSIFSSNEDERASRDILLIPKTRKRVKGVLLVADAKNLKRSIAIALQFAEYGLPMILDINMIDEASSRGIEVDIVKLSEILGIEVCTTIAREGIGIEKLRALLRHIKPAQIKPLHSSYTEVATPTVKSAQLKVDKTKTSQQRFRYSDKIEEFIELVEKLVPVGDISPRALALLLLTEDKCVESYISQLCGDVIIEQLQHVVHEYREDSSSSIEVYLENLYHKEAALIANQVIKSEPPTKNSFVLTFGDWCTQLSTGIPIAICVTALLYLFVGTFAATFLVDSINSLLFENILIPFITKYVQFIPSQFLRDMIIDPDFGVLPTGVFLALGLVLPVIFCFYIAFGILEDSGYLPRISILLDKVFKQIGLNGKGVIPIVMGFSCITMALLTTRMLNSEKEKNIASFLIFLCMPCAPLIAVMLVILERMPFSATITVFGIIFSQIFIAGYLANKVISGSRSYFIMEIPVMRIPKPWAVIKMAARKSHHFMKEAVPVFIYASIAIFLFQRAGGLAMVEKYLGPLIHQILGLPEQSIQVFIKTMIRRESGAAELEHLRYAYTNLQLVVNLLVMTFIAPCINAIIVLFKERGINIGAVIMGTVIVYAFIIGSVVNYTCLAFGITFS